MQKLDIRTFTLTAGLFWAVSVFLTGLMVTFFHYGDPWFNLLASVYPWYTATLPGILIGALWGFLDGAIGGFVFSWLYNRLLPTR